MRDARQTRGGERRRWDGGEEERKTQEPRTGQFTAARGRTCALAVSQTILIDLDAAQTVARRVLASSGTPRTVRITRGKKLRRNVFFLARGASKLFSDDRTKIRATVTCRARVLFSSPLAVSESPTRETPLHPARLPPSSRARRHVRAHRANVSRESSNEHARALPRAPSPRSTGATFFGVSPKFSGRPRGRDDGSHPHPSRRRQLAARRGRCLGTPHREVRHRPRGGRSRVPHPGPPQIRPQGSLAQSRRGAPSRG